MLWATTAYCAKLSEDFFKKSKNYGAKTSKPGQDPNFKTENGGMAKIGFKALKGAGEGGKGEGIAYKYRNKRPYITPKSSINRFRPGLRPEPRWESLRRFPAPLVGCRMISPRHSPPPRRLRRLASQRFRRFDVGARA